MSLPSTEREHLIFRLFWMLLFFFVWQLAELLLLGLTLVQVALRLARGQASGELAAFGDSLSQYIAQIGRFATFNTEHKPWPVSDWPAARPADVDRVVVAPTPGESQEPRP